MSPVVWGAERVPHTKSFIKPREVHTYMIWTIFFIILAAHEKAIMDLSSEGKLLSWEPVAYWNKAQSWKYKWKNGDQAQGEAFFGSSTVFVFLTDGWHLSQFVFLNAMFAAMVIYKPIFQVDSQILGLALDFTLLRVIFGLVFELFYSKLYRTGASRGV